MESFRSWSKRNQSKYEEQQVLLELQKTEKMLLRRRDEYAEKAKNALKEGSRSQYTAYVSLLKNAIFYLAQTRDMTANFTMARDLRTMQSVGQHFVHAIDGVMKEVYKTSRSINAASSQQVFTKALSRQNATAHELQDLLSSNNIAFSCSMETLSDVSDEEVRKILENEIKKDESDFEETLKKLEEEFSIPQQYAQESPVRKEPAAPLASGVAEGAAAAMPPAMLPLPCSDEGQPPVIAQEDDLLPHDPTDSEGPKNTFDVDHIAFRPQYLRDYIGQPNAVATVSDPIKKARLTGRPLPHILICGSYGQGKTTLAKIIANEMKGNFITVSAGIKHRDMLRILRSLKPNDIVFIDEVHKLATDVIETLLYPAMEDFEVPVAETTDLGTLSKAVKIAPFTLIGATTETGKLLKPFYSKFPINVTLVDYQLDTIASIVKNSFRVTNIAISDELAYAVARRSRLSPRMANAYVNGIGASAIVREAERRRLPDGSLRDEDTVRALNIHITEQDVNEYFDRIGVDSYGLREEERKLLHVVIDMYHGGPVGQENLAKALNMATNRIDQEYEPYLIKLGFLNVRPQGRFATEAAYRYLSDISGGAMGAGGVPPMGEALKIDEAPISVPSTAEEAGLPIEECEIGAFSAEEAAWLDELFSGDGAPAEESLDDLFAGAKQEQDLAAEGGRILRSNGGRKVFCGSPLACQFLKALFASGYISDARSGALELGYATPRMAEQRYFPDFVLKLYDGRIAVVETKELSSIGYHLNIAKYNALAAYCREHGFVYAEVAFDDETGRYISAEQLKALPVDESLHALILRKLEENGFCSGADLAGYGIKEITAVLLNDPSLKNVDRTGHAPQIMYAYE